MTIRELLEAAMADEGSRHSNGRFYTLEQVLDMQLMVATKHGSYRAVLSVYPFEPCNSIVIDME